MSFCDKLWCVGGVFAVAYAIYIAFEEPADDCAHCPPVFKQHTAPKDAPAHVVYDILRRNTEALAKSNGWPDADARRSVEAAFDGGGGRRFKDGEGPVAAVAFHRATFLLQAGFSDVFWPFVEELQAQLDSPLDVRWTPPDALHTFIAGFTEHPSLLAPGDVPRYRPLPDAKLADLGDHLEAAVAALRKKESRLGWTRVWGYALTTDGTMCVLLEDVRGNIARLRKTVRGLSPLPRDVPVRPSTLIHAVVGRITVYPKDLSLVEHVRANKVVAKWAAALREDRDPGGAPLPYIGALSRLHDMDLCRERVFPFRNHTTFRRVALLKRWRPMPLEPWEEPGFTGGHYDEPGDIPELLRVGPLG